MCACMLSGDIPTAVDAAAVLVTMQGQLVMTQIVVKLTLWCVYGRPAITFVVDAEHGFSLRLGAAAANRGHARAMSVDNSSGDRVHAVDAASCAAVAVTQWYLVVTG